MGNKATIEYKITSEAWGKKTNTIKKILTDYRNDKDFFNRKLLRKKIFRLKKFIMGLDPYMHYNGNNTLKKNKLRRFRNTKNETTLFFLHELWKFYLLLTRIILWDDLRTVCNKKKVFVIIDLFLEKENDIRKIITKNEIFFIRD